MNQRIAAGPWRLLMLAALVALAACGKHKDGKVDDDDAPKAAPATASAAASAASQVGGDADKPINLSNDELKDAGIQLATLKPSSISVPVTLTGSVNADPDRYAKVLPRLPGRIVSVSAPLGATVNAGQALALIESIELGEVRSARAQARSEAVVAEAALERAERLAAEDIVPRKDQLRARADAERARSTLQAADDKLRMLGTSAAAPAGANQATYALVSPLAGTVIERQAVAGTLVDKEPLFVVADLSTVRVMADVFERDLGRLALGAAADVTVAAYPNQHFAGRLVYLSDTLDPATRTVKAHVEVVNRDRRLKPGMFASATVATSASEQGLALPAGAVTLIDGKPTVFVLEGKGFVPRSVEVGAELGGRVPVRQGLRAGEQVVSRGAYALKARMLKSQLGADND